MKISIIGSGAMGCLFGALLSCENEVKIFSRNKKTVDYINKYGIKINEKDNSSAIFRPCSALSGSDSEKSELTLIMVKSYDTCEALSVNSDLIRNSEFIITLQNGLGNDSDIMKYVERNRILIGTTEHNSSLKDIAEVYHGGDGATVIGRLDGNDIPEKFISSFSECGIDVQVSKDVEKLIWKKLLLNIAVNAVTAILGIPTGMISENKNITDICRYLVEEAVTTAGIYGLEFKTDDIMNDVLCLSKRQPYARTSMYTDILNNRRTEIDSINGAVVKIAENAGIKVPCNRMITDMIHIIEKKGCKF